MQEKLKQVSPLLRNTCGKLIGVDARSVASVATDEGRTNWAIYKRRSRAELRLGLVLPRQHKIGRPRKLPPPTIGLPADGFDLKMVG